MKRRYYTYMVVLCSLLVFTGCDKESVVTPDTDEKVPITLSASSFPVSVDVQTRAETLNSKSIGIVAAKATGSSLSDVTSWTGTGYYLDHVWATGTNTNLNGEKEVTFTQPQWWPFNPAEYLAFVAYSPYYGTEGDASRVTRVGGTNILKVTAGTTDAFPDFLYTAPVGPWNKETAKALTSKAVSLGEFRHAMAKLDIEVKLVDKDGNDIEAAELPNPNPLKITELKISTKVDNGEFALPENSTIPTWSLGTELTEAKSVYTPVSSASPAVLANTPLIYTCLLLPGTESDSFVSITVSDGVGEAKLESKEISGFDHISPSTEVKLEMGKTTKLTIKVRYVGIPDPPDPENPGTDLILQGQLLEWDYKGKSEVIIE